MKNNKIVYLISAAVILIISVSAFIFYSNRKPSLQPAVSSKPAESSTLANQASVYCREQGGESQIITAVDGSQSGDCVFSDG